VSPSLEDTYLHFLMLFEAEVHKAMIQANAVGKDVRYQKGMMDAIGKCHEIFLDLAEKEDIHAVFPLEGGKEESQ
jgi:hypothetical protein